MEWIFPYERKLKITPLVKQDILRRWRDSRYDHHARSCSHSYHNKRVQATWHGQGKPLHTIICHMNNSRKFNESSVTGIIGHFIKMDIFPLDMITKNWPLKLTIQVWVKSPPPPNALTPHTLPTADVPPYKDTWLLICLTYPNEW